MHYEVEVRELHYARGRGGERQVVDARWNTMGRTWPDGLVPVRFVDLRAARAFVSAADPAAVRIVRVAKSRGREVVGRDPAARALPEGGRRG